MKHPSFEILQDYFENALETKLAERVRDHLDACDQCSGMLADFIMIEQEVLAEPRIEVSEQTLKRIRRDASDLLSDMKKRKNSRRELGVVFEEWKQQILPELKLPALQVCSVSIMLFTIVSVEKIEELGTYKPISTDVHVTYGEDL